MGRAGCLSGDGTAGVTSHAGIVDAGESQQCGSGLAVPVAASRIRSFSEFGSLRGELLDSIAGVDVALACSMGICVDVAWTTSGLPLDESMTELLAVRKSRMSWYCGLGVWEAGSVSSGFIGSDVATGPAAF